MNNPPRKCSESREHLKMSFSLNSLQHLLIAGCFVLLWRTCFTYFPSETSACHSCVVTHFIANVQINLVESRKITDLKLRCGKFRVNLPVLPRVSSVRDYFMIQLEKLVEPVQIKRTVGSVLGKALVTHTQHTATDTTPPPPHSLSPYMPALSSAFDIQRKEGPSSN